MFVYQSCSQVFISMQLIFKGESYLDEFKQSFYVYLRSVAEELGMMIDITADYSLILVLMSFIPGHRVGTFVVILV